MSIDAPVKVTPEARKITTKPRVSDQIFRGIVTAFSFSALLILSMIAIFLLIQGFTTFKEQGIGFITNFEWTVVIDENGVETANFGLQAMLLGTLVISIIALVFAVPLSVLTALFLTFYAPERIKRILVTIIDLMAAFPSILYGLWGFFVLMPMAEYWAKLIHKWLGWIYIFDVPDPIYTRSPFIAGLVLAIMIIPIVTSVSREVFSQTPLDRIQAAYALGATRWAMIKAVVIPYGRSGVVGGAMLGLGRALGETVAVYLLLNLVFKYNFNILESEGGNIASLIATKFGEATPYELKALLAAGFVLFLLTLSVNMAATAVVQRTAKAQS